MATPPKRIGLSQVEIVSPELRKALGITRPRNVKEAQEMGLKLSPLPFVIKAVCQALGQHPKLNGEHIDSCILKTPPNFGGKEVVIEVNFKNKSLKFFREGTELK